MRPNQSSGFSFIKNAYTYTLERLWIILQHVNHTCILLLLCQGVWPKSFSNFLEQFVFILKFYKLYALLLKCGFLKTRNICYIFNCFVSSETYDSHGGKNTRPSHILITVLFLRFFKAQKNLLSKEIHWLQKQIYRIHIE